MTPAVVTSITEGFELSKTQAKERSIQIEQTVGIDDEQPVDPVPGSGQGRVNDEAEPTLQVTRRLMKKITVKSGCGFNLRYF